ncbi:MAG: hypothetical protein Q8R15_00995 [Candidatus Micrarchaeota archaeon]|nr:hypothetical protein [Candidatus Micrarchaeota archaeon]
MKKFFSLMLLAVFLFGCVSTTPDASSNASQASQNSNGFEAKLVDNWRSFSDYTNTQVLELRGDNTWKLSSSSGRWRVENITAADWENWQIEPYGPEKKIILDGWNGAIADGPIEESDDKTRVDFFWVIYLVNLDVYGEDRQAQVKYGHANWD